MDKRLFATVWLVASIWLMWLMFNDMEKARKAKQAAPPADARVVEKNEAPDPADPANPQEAPEEKPEPPPEPVIEAVENIVLGNAEEGPDSTFYLEANLTNLGGVVRDVYLNRYRNEDRTGRLKAISTEDSREPAYMLWTENDESLRSKAWQVVDRQPERVSFKTKTKDGIEVTKSFVLEPKSKMTKLVLEFTNPADQAIPKFHYYLTGGVGVPLEGEWYTRYFRNATFLMRAAASPSGQLVEETAQAIVDKKINGDNQLSFSKTPVQFAGPTSQYFASLIVQPFNLAEAPEQNQIGEASPRFLSRNPKRPELSEAGVEIRSLSFTLNPGQTIKHEYLLFNGPKEKTTLEEFKQYELPQVIHYPSFFFIPVSFFSQSLVAVLEIFHSIVRDYGLAIILLTVVVRLTLFPLNFWQTRTMSRMQAIQPLMDKIRKESGNNMEEYGRRMRELQAEHKVNPYMGCLPALVQLPILMGLWQGLATNFHLRHAPFLFGTTWIDDLSAPDMLFEWPVHVGIIDSYLGPYFNLLPIISLAQIVIVMLVSAPPATSPDAIMMRRVMIGMMFFMSFMFFKVPSGLCVYIITSSLWGLMERKLMPKPPISPRLKELAEQAKEAAQSPETAIDVSWKKVKDNGKKKPARR